MFAAFEVQVNLAPFNLAIQSSFVSDSKYSIPYKNTLNNYNFCKNEYDLMLQKNKCRS